MKCPNPEIDVTTDSNDLDNGSTEEHPRGNSYTITGGCQAGGAAPGPAAALLLLGLAWLRRRKRR